MLEVSDYDDVTSFPAVLHVPCASSSGSTVATSAASGLSAVASAAQGVAQHLQARPSRDGFGTRDGPYTQSGYPSRGHCGSGGVDLSAAGAQAVHAATGFMDRLARDMRPQGRGGAPQQQNCQQQ